MAKKINIRPSTSVYATYKNIKYDPWTAIAEYVDNSTQSYYDNKTRLCNTKYWDKLKIEIFYEKDVIIGDKIIIRDNAFGMDFNDFQRAIILDSPPAKATRSEFGMGLKTASCWFGLNWSVESTTLGSSVKYIAEVDVDILHKYKNEEIEVQEIDCNSREHGTTITIWNLNRTISGRQIGKMKDQLRGIYRTDLRSNEIAIYYNGEALSYEEPNVLEELLPDGSTKTWKKSVNFTLINNDKTYTVSGFIALREKAGTSSAGFSLIRRGRVIVGGYENAYRPEEIFEKSNSFVYQRLYGELNLDDWPVTQTKDAFDWYCGLEDLLIDKLNEVCSEYIKKAKDYRVGKKITIDTGITSLVNTFNKAGVIQNVDIQPLLNNSNEDVQIPILEFAQDILRNSDISETDTETTYNNSNDIIIEGEIGKKIVFEINSKKYIFNLILQKDDPYRHWLYISPNQGEYNVEWNIRHLFFKPYIDDPAFLNVMQQFIFALAIAEIDAMNSNVNGKIESSAIRMKMNDILKDVTKGGVLHE